MIMQDSSLTSGLKRGRSNSISGRLRAASDLEECGVVNKYEKGMLKDCIISGDTELESAIEKYEMKGDATALRAFIDQNSALPSMEILDSIELGFLSVFSKGGRGGTRFDSFDSDFNLGLTENDEEEHEKPKLSSDSSNLAASCDDEYTSNQQTHLNTTKPTGSQISSDPNINNLINQSSLCAEPLPISSFDTNISSHSKFPSSSIASQNEFLNQHSEPSNRKHSFDFVDQDLINYRRSYRTNSSSIGSFSGIIGLLDSDLFNPDSYTGRRDSFSFADINQSEDFDDLAKTNFPFQKGSNTGQDIDLSHYDAMAASLSLAPSDHPGSGPGSGPLMTNNHNTGAIDTMKSDLQVQGKPSMSISSGLTSQYMKMNHAVQMDQGRAHGHGSASVSGYREGYNASHSIQSNSPRPPLPLVKKERMEGADDGTSLHVMPLPNPAKPEGQGFIGAYSPESRRQLIERFNEKRKHRVWTKKVKYDVRKNFADSRLRIKGRFVKKEDEEIMRVLLT